MTSSMIPGLFISRTDTGKEAPQLLSLYRHPKRAEQVAEELNQKAEQDPYNIYHYFVMEVFVNEEILKKK